MELALHRLEAERINEFRERFFSFSDAVIRSVDLRFRNSSGFSFVKVTISSRDRETRNDDGWVNVIIEVQDVSELRMTENQKESYQVLSNGIYVVKMNDLFYIEFGSCIDEPSDVDEVRQSRFYVAGREVHWKVVPYGE
jgi:hypothetical protein